jgi:hypothetical protein
MIKKEEVISMFIALFFEMLKSLETHFYLYWIAEPSG